MSADRELVRLTVADALRGEAFEGHCFALLHSVCQKAVTRINTRSRTKMTRDEVVEIVTGMDAFVVDGRTVALQRYEEAERIVADQIAALLKEPTYDEPITQLLPDADLKLDTQQLRAVDLMVNAPVGIVTGPPGSGKTTIVEEALLHLHELGERCALAAPTGKAARRLQETSKQTALTLHRLLEWTYLGFERHEANPLDTDLVLVDESSMIDIELCADLLRAVQVGKTRVIFVGDADQLPPVGPGAPFRDLIASGKVPTVRLDTVHRAAARSWIYRNAPKILAGSGVELDDCADFEFHELGAGDGGYLGAACLDIIKTLQAEGFGPQDYQVLVPMRKRDAGTGVLNPYLQGELNPDRLSLQLSDAVEISEGDCVIQTRNDYEMSVMNGEVGRVERIDSTSRIVQVQFPTLPGSTDDGFRQYRTSKQLRNLELAYALTVHKFQGSQVPAVIFVCHSLHKFMLSRQLLYTALTRARKRVYLVGDAGGINHALRTIKDTQRRTKLQERLCA